MLSFPVEEIADLWKDGGAAEARLFKSWNVIPRSLGAPLVAQRLKHLPAVWETGV